MTDPEPGTIGVLIIDDHRMFAESLSRLLADEEGISVLATAASITTMIFGSRCLISAAIATPSRSGI
jgi:DNA-binding NarL/FixJ family response regulator